MDVESLITLWLPAAMNEIVKNGISATSGAVTLYDVCGFAG